MTIENLFSPESLEPRTCWWCANGSPLMWAADRDEAVVCLDMSTRKSKTLQRSARGEKVRWWLQVMDGMETCERFRPIARDAERMRWMVERGYAPPEWLEWKEGR